MHLLSPQRCLLTAGVTLALGAMCTSPATAQDNGLFLNIQPPGQSGYLTLLEAAQFLSDGTLPPHVDDQRLMYSDLVHAPPGLTDGDLLTYFKLAPIAPSANSPDFLNPPFDGVTITRDDFGVPHIEAGNRARLFYGIGYAMAADKLFAMELSRRAGRGRLSEALGANPTPDPGLLDFALDQDEAMYQFAGYDDADLDAALQLMLDEFGGKARRAQRLLDSFLQGVNAYVAYVNFQPITRAPAEHVVLGLTPIAPFTKRDILAVATILEQLFGAGGGGEHTNAILLQKLRTAYGIADGEALYRDLRQVDEPEAATTTELTFPYLEPGPVDPAAVAMPDLGSILSPPAIQITGPLPPGYLMASQVTSERSRLRDNPYHPSMSNFLAVSGEHAAGGHPIAVMGPQVAYFVPALLTEISIDGAGMSARGAAVTGTPFVVLGRGPTYAWSATAGGSDVVDVRAEKLCEPDMSPPSIMSKHYLFNSQCLPMYERLDTWCIGDATFCTANGDNVTATVQRSGHGQVFARATVGGEPVALVRQRSTFMREGQNGIAFARIDRRTTKTFRRFAGAARLLPGSFNWLYVNEEELGYVHSGRYPVRAAGVDPDLPSWGTGEWEWQGLLDSDARPQEVNPARGYFTSWNNKPAPGWRASDGNYSFGTVHRVDSLDDRVEAAIASNVPIGVAQMVEMMEDAGTTDLRGSQVLPHALAIIGSEVSLDPALTILDTWVQSGAFRRDRDASGQYDHSSAVAIMDEWFERMIDAVFGGQLGAFYADIPLGFDNRPGTLGSAYQSGYYGLLQKALRMAQGLSVAAPFEQLQCADGTLAGCRTALVDSLSDAVAELTIAFGSADPADWEADPTVDQIEFTPFGAATVDPIPWINRPTFQQVVQVTGAAP